MVRPKVIPQLLQEFQGQGLMKIQIRSKASRIPACRI